ncbi:MAG: cysteine synthase family protein [Gemmatimonadota bacterium]
MSRFELPTQGRYQQLIAPTPLVAVSLDRDSPRVWVKLEFLNPSGSIKDRIARYMIEKAWRRGELRPGSEVVEASSGSTSISLALVCAQFGLRFTAVMPEGVSRERRLILSALGARFELTPRDEGMRETLRRAAAIAEERGAFETRQFKNPENAEAHRIWTGQEILSQLPGGSVDAVVSGVGTGGTIVGLFAAFRENGCPVTPYAARPVDGSVVSELECCSISPRFSSRVPGVVDCVSELYTPEALPGLVELDVSDELAIETTRRLIRRGFPVGPSSGLNFAAAIKVARQLGDGAEVVTVFPDRMERYFSTELFAGEE